MFRLKTINKKVLTIILALITLIAVSSTFVYIAFKDPSVTQVLGKESSETRYVLVNEDDGWEFEGKKYELGRDFVTLVSQDEQHKWSTSNRSQAKAGIEDGEYDAMIVIPKNFSQSVLSLQSIDPQKANIEYHIRNGQNQVTQQVIEKNINTVLYDFNKKIVQMYFSSVVASVTDAQQNVTGIVDTEYQNSTFLKNYIQTPFQSFPQSFSSVSAITNSLQSNSTAIENEQKSFVSSVTSLMDGNAEEAGGIADTLQPEGNGTNASDSSASTNQYSGLDIYYNKMLASLMILGAEESATPSQPVDSEGTPVKSIYTHFLENAKQYESAQELTKTALETNIKKVEGQISDLQNLQQVISSKYYGDSKLTPETATIENAKEAIAVLMNPDKRSKLDKDYLSQLNIQVGATPTASLSSLIDELVTKNVITGDQANLYRSELALVNRYASDFGVGTGTTTSYNFVNRQESAKANSFQTTATFNISTGGDTISLNGEGVSISNGGDVAAQIQSSLNHQLAPYNKAATVSASSNGFVISIHDTASTSTPAESTTVETTPAEITPAESTPGEKPQADQGTNEQTNTPEKEVTSSNRVQTQVVKVAVAPNSLPVTVSVNLSWASQPTGNRSYKEVDYQWTNSQGGISSGKLAVFDTKNDTIVQDLPLILNNFSSLDKAAQQITTIFSDPSESVTSFALRAQNNNTPLGDLAGPNSVYYRYNNIDKKTLAKSVSNEFAEAYKKDGDYIYNELNKRITDLTTILGTPDSTATSEKEVTLYGLLNSIPSQNDYYQLIAELGDWYNNAKVTLDDFYKSDTSSRTEQDAANTAKLTNVASQLRNIQKSAKDISKQTETTASGLPKMEEVVKSFSTDVQQLEQSVNTVLDSVNKYASNTDSNLADNQKYVESFNKVLANTKNGGADNQKVFNFLSSPIEVSAIKGSTAKVSIIPYYMTVVSALLTISISFFTMYLINPRSLDKRDKIKTPNRIWYNLPNTVKINSIAGISAMAFAIVTSTILQSVSKVVWILYTFLLVFALINLFVYLLRKFERTLTLYIFTFLLGIYLLLMPIIGSSTKPGTIVSLLYRFSPFQNIENGYVALINGIGVGGMTIFILVLVAFAVTLLNLFIKPLKEESV